MLLLQLSNAEDPIEVIVDGITTDVNEMQLVNANAPIAVTVDGIVIDGNDEQYPKELSPIIVTEDGIDGMDDKFEHAQNELVYILNPVFPHLIIFIKFK